MRLLRGKASNFGSFKTVEFDFSSQELTLISGSTGSGKSTLQNLPLWALFGVTSKNGTSDEVRNWHAPKEHTSVELTVLVDTPLTVYRSRGKHSQNDLYWTEEGSEVKHRGVNLSETQDLLESRLKVSPDLFLSAACYNEFSPTNTFFTDKAKDRRELFEKIANLEFPVALSEKATTQRSKTKKTLVLASTKLAQLTSKIEGQNATYAKAASDAKRWDKSQADLVNELHVKSKNFQLEIDSKVSMFVTKSTAFESQKGTAVDKLMDSIESLQEKIAKADSHKCITCGHTNDPIEVYALKLDQLMTKLEEASYSENPWESRIEETKQSKNFYEEQALLESTKVNPISSVLLNLVQDVQSVSKQLKTQEVIVNEINEEISVLTQVHELSMELRGRLLSNAVKSIAFDTNKYLEEFFDSEIKVELSMPNSDDLEVALWKDGFSCSFKQLSKGQRSLLKLCFAVAVMKAASDRHGVHFDTLFFDEALDGLDDALKIKAYRLFESLASKHSTVLIIDHSESLKSLINKEFHVELTSEGSRIDEN
jgi:DNA repair exonuclease SbcCD ATPase subunit